MSTKKFSKQCHKENDQLGKNAGVLHLVQAASINRVWVNTARTGVDIHFTRTDGSVGTLECEVKKAWEGGKFPYETINALGRKGKFFETGAAWLLLSNNKQDYLLVSGEDIIASPMEEVRNQYSLTGEMFYKVPVSKAIFWRFGTPLYELPVDCGECASTVIDCSDKTNICCGQCGRER